MIARALQCRPHLLRLAVAEHLSADEHDQLSTHLETCESCRQELELLSGGSQWQSRVQECLSASQLASTDQPVAIDDDERANDWLVFLEPSNDPSKLGRIGNYEVESLVGRGGFGTVFKALDPELNRYVAIKVLSTPLANSAAARKRFTREARQAAAVVHDHVVPIHHVDTSGKFPFLVMPFLSGRSLQERLDAEGTLSVEEVLRITMQTAQGLAAAHAQGLIHRDIKPANILLENGVERVRISDFGLARAVDDATQTQSGFIAGTPAYMAPEQARGEPLDARADLFSLGSVMYAMFAGHPPFRAETTLAVLRRICDDEPRDVREHSPAVPDWLWEIMQRLLAKSPDDRFQSAADVADLLSRWLAHLQNPTSVAPPARLASGGCKSPGDWSRRRAGEQASRREKNRRAVAIVAGCILVVAAIVGGWFARDMFRNTSANRQDKANQHETADAVGAAAAADTQRWPGLKPDQLQAELNAAWGDTLAAESRLAVPPREPSYALDQELLRLDRQVRQLEYEETFPPLPRVNDRPKQ